jgi:hypothetical protein
MLELDPSLCDASRDHRPGADPRVKSEDDGEGLVLSRRRFDPRIRGAPMCIAGRDFCLGDGGVRSDPRVKPEDDGEGLAVSRRGPVPLAVDAIITITSLSATDDSARPSAS